MPWYSSYSLSREIKVDLIPKQMRSRQRLIVFLVAVVSFLEKNITAFLIVDRLMDGYMVKESTDDIVTLYLFILNFSSLSFRSDSWKMVTHK